MISDYLSIMSQWKGSAGVDTGRFRNKQKKLMKKMNFPEEFNIRVNMEKVALPVLKGWIANRITEILGFEDEVVVNFIFNMLENARKNKVPPSPKDMQVQLTGFLERDAKPFMEELWHHIVTASRNPGGIPTKVLEDAKKELSEKRYGTRRRAKGIERSVKEEREKKEPSKPEKPKKDTPVSEMQANIERIMKKRQAEQLKVPRTLADTLSDVIRKKKKREEEEKQPEPKPVKSESNGSAKVRESTPPRKRITPSPEPRRSPPRKRRDRDLSRSPRRRRSRSRSRGRRYSRREPAVSPSPSPPEELREMRKAKRRNRNRS